MVSRKLHEILPKIKMKLSTERSFDQQWRDYLLNPTLESPLKKEINNQITDLILSSIIDQKHQLEELMVVLETLKEQDALIKEPDLQKEDPNRTGSMQTAMADDILFYEYTMSLLLVITGTLIKDINYQISNLTAIDEELGVRISLIDQMMNSQFVQILEEFSEECEGIILGKHPVFSELIQAFSLDKIDQILFHNKIGHLISELHREEHGVEPHEGVLDSMRERVVNRAGQLRQLGRERNELVEKKEEVCRNLEECRRLAREARGLKQSVKTARPGEEADLAHSVKSLHKRFHPIPQFSASCRKKDEDEKEHIHRFQKRV